MRQDRRNPERRRRGVLGWLRRLVRAHGQSLTPWEETKLLELAEEIASDRVSDSTEAGAFDRSEDLEEELRERLVAVEQRPAWWREVHDLLATDWLKVSLKDQVLEASRRTSTFRRDLGHARRHGLDLRSRRAALADAIANEARLSEKLSARVEREAAEAAPRPAFTKRGPKPKTLRTKGAAREAASQVNAKAERRAAEMKVVGDAIRVIARSRHRSFRDATLIYLKNENVRVPRLVP